MEEMLGRFQGDLGNISTEIRSLQEQSQNMSVKLKNRKAAEQKLGTFLDSLAITGPLIDGIVQREVDEDYQVRSCCTSQMYQLARLSQRGEGYLRNPCVFHIGRNRHIFCAEST